jgi:hypothetical protein
MIGELGIWNRTDLTYTPSHGTRIGDLEIWNRIDLRYTPSHGPMIGELGIWNRIDLRYTPSHDLRYTTQVRNQLILFKCKILYWYVLLPVPSSLLYKNQWSEMSVGLNIILFDNWYKIKRHLLKTRIWKKKHAQN